MQDAKKTVHIAPVGFHSDKIIASIRQYPVHKIIILRHHDDEKKEKVETAITEIEKSFIGIVVERQTVERDNLMKAALDIIELIKKEVLANNKVMLNISGGLRNQGIACYFAALVSETDIYTDIPESSVEEGYILKNILTIPHFPIKQFRRESMEVLEALNEIANSQDELILRMKYKLNPENLSRERSRLNHHIKQLKTYGLVDTKKSGKNIIIQRTELGELYVRGENIKMLKDNPDASEVGT